jgi:catechol 2,3-dioxygenase-like lactoylglutathione lyase family enzyme
MIDNELSIGALPGRQSGELMSTMMVKDVDAILLLVEEPRRSARFYGDILGFRKIFEHDNRIMYDMSGVRLLLHPIQGQFKDSKGKYEAAWGVAIYLEVENVDKTIGFLRDQGVEIFEEPKNRPWGVRDAGVRDPDGYYIYFSQHSETSWKKEIGAVPTASSEQNSSD